MFGGSNSFFFKKLRNSIDRFFPLPSNRLPLPSNKLPFPSGKNIIQSR